MGREDPAVGQTDEPGARFQHTLQQSQPQPPARGMAVDPSLSTPPSQDPQGASGAQQRGVTGGGPAGQAQPQRAPAAGPANVRLQQAGLHFERRFTKRGVHPFDEVGALFAHAPLRALLVQLARRCRKYGASLVVATQNAEDLLSREDGRVVATNCSTVLLGGQRPAETERMEAAFGLTAEQRRFVETAGRGEFLVLAGARRVEMRVSLPDP